MLSNFYQNNITYVSINEFPFVLDTKSESFFIGSCFATNMYNIFSNYYLNAYTSPFGNVYNPKSIEKSLSRLLNTILITEEECILADGIYQHPDFHSSLGKSNITDFLGSINSQIIEGSTNLLKSNFIFITLGTAYIYENKMGVVNNCHKQPKDFFNRRKLELSEIVDSIVNPLVELKKINPHIKIILSLSPVRHLRDNPLENSLSKALLRVAIDEVTKSVESYYFPSYEIMLDELRDYRWYDKSLSHPSEVAIEYIISRFLENSVTADLEKYIIRIRKLNNMLTHKIINPESKSTTMFIQKLEKTLKQIKLDYKYLNNLQEIDIKYINKVFY